MGIKSNETFDLLSKLMTEKADQLTAERLQIRQKYDELYEHVTKKLAQRLNESVYEEKTNLMMQLEQLLRRMEFFVKFPKVANTTFITVIGAAKEAENFFKQVLPEKDAKYIRMNTNVPAIICNDETTININSLNTLGNIESLAFKEYVNANRDLYKKGIDIRRLVQLYYLPVMNSSYNTTFLYLPSYSLKEQDMYTLLGDMIETAIVFIDDKGIWKREIQALLKSGVVDKIHLLAPASKLEEIHNVVQTEDIIAVYPINGDIQEWFQKLDIPSYNTGFEELLFEKLMKYRTSIETMIEKQNNLIRNISKDILNTSEEETEQLFRSLRTKIKKENKEIKENHTELLKDIKESVELAQHLDRLVVEQSHVEMTKVAKTTPLITQKTVTLVLSLIDNNDLSSARGYMAKLKQFCFEHSRALEIYIGLTKSSELSISDINYLSQDGIKREISRIQLKAWPQLKMGAKALQDLEKIYGKSYDSTVLYELGLAYEKAAEHKNAQKYYWRSVNLGEVKAAERLIQFIDKNNIRDMEKLGRMMIPEANYHVGCYYLHEVKIYKKAVAAFKMAAAYEHLGAIKELSYIEFFDYIKVRKKDSDKAESMLESLIFLHQYLLENGEDEEEVRERLGKLFYWNEYFQKARPLLEKCNTADAQFLCGKIFQYGNGHAQDLVKAKSFFEKAKKLGHKQAENEYFKVEGWIQSNQSREQYSANRSYVSTSTTSYSSSSSSKSKQGCFLTTATCVALDKPDNCEEIMAFKAYRDNSLAKDSDGEKFIIEYYRIAPLLVEAIDATPNAKEKYVYLYNKYIKVGYGYLKEKNLVDAKQTYIAMVKELCKEYNIQPFNGDQ